MMWLVLDFDGPEYAACRITIQGEGLENLQELLEFDFDGIKSFYVYVVRKLRGQIEDLRNVGQCISNPWFNIPMICEKKL